MAENIIQIAEALNADVTRLNSERNKLEGKLESAKSSYENAIKEYEEKYGVKLTEKNLQSEYNEVYARTKGSVLDLQEKIESIKRGDYKKEDNSVEFELEPEVEPIRAEVEKKPAKRGRKPKAEKVVDVEPEEIEVTSDDEIAIDEGPIKLDFDSSASEEVEEVKVEVKEEKPVSKAGRKSLSAAELAAAAVAESANVVQNPIQLGDIVDEDEVDLSGMSFGEAPKSATPVKEEAPKKTKEEKIEIPAEPTDFGSFGDFSSMSFDSFDAGLETSTDEVEDVDDVEDVVDDVEDVVEEVSTTETKVEETTGFGDFGGFGDFSDFGGFGTVEESKPEVKEEVKPEVKEDVKPVETNDFGDFGGFGGFGDMSEISVEEPKKEDKKAEPLSPEDWGFGDSSSDFGKTLEEDTFNFADMSDFKFGE